MKRAAALLAALFWATGCAVTRIKPAVPVMAADPAPLTSALEEYNRLDWPVRISGRIKGDGPALDYGGRAVPGLGTRFDAVMGPMAKLVFSAACIDQESCEIYFPDENKLYRDASPGTAEWLRAFLTGRVVKIGPTSGASADATGSLVLNIAGPGGRWEKVFFSVDGRLPERVIYGEAGDPASFEIKFADFESVGGRFFPTTVTLGGSLRGQEIVFHADTIERTPEPSGAILKIRTLPGVEVEEPMGRDAWKKLGMFWTPKDWAAEKR